MISPLYRICNCLFVFRSSNRKLLLYIDVLLEKHRVGRGIIANEQIEVTLHEIGKVLFDNEEPYYESKKAKLFCIEQKQFALIKAEDIRTPNSLYYHFLDPMLKNVFRRKGVICLHGAGALIQGRGIIFLGNRNAGKSTISILNLLNGGKFLTDDVIYLDGGMAHTIYRPIHIDPKFAETIGIGGRIDINDKYLDKESEVNYYPDLYHSKQVIHKMKIDQLVYLSTIKESELKLYSLETPSQKIEMLETQQLSRHEIESLELLSLKHTIMVWGQTALNNFPTIVEKLIST